MGFDLLASGNFMQYTIAESGIAGVHAMMLHVKTAFALIVPTSLTGYQKYSGFRSCILLHIKIAYVPDL